MKFEKGFELMSVKVKIWFIIAIIDVAGFWYFVTSYDLSQNQLGLLALAAVFGPVIALAAIDKMTGKDMYNDDN